MNWPKFKESLRLIALQISILFFHFWEWIRVVFLYYRNLNFALPDQTVLLLSFWDSPFRLCRVYREEREKKGEQDLDNYTYGETPITSMDKMVKAFQIEKHHHILEMGSGRGRLAFFLSQIVGCKVTGVENVPALYQISQKAYQLFKPKNVDFLLEDFFLTQVNHFDVIYLFGTTLSDEKLDILTKRFEECPKGTKIITISYPLHSSQFEVTSVITARFDFGETECYLQIKTV